MTKDLKEALKAQAAFGQIPAYFWLILLFFAYDDIWQWLTPTWIILGLTGYGLYTASTNPVVKPLLNAAGINADLP